MRQLGSLGGGNHFIEVCIDTENKVWLMLHSGSRNIGNKLAQCHIETAKDLAKLADLSLPDRDLAYFVAGTPEFAAYWRDFTMGARLRQNQSRCDDGEICAGYGAAS